MNRFRADWWRPLYLQIRYNSLVTFVLVGLAAWGLEQIAGAAWNRQGILGLLLAVLSTVIAVLLLRGAVWLFGRIRQDDASLPGASPPVRRGLILLYGREATAQEAIQHHRDRLDFIWFVLTEQTKSEFNTMRNHWWGRAAATPELVHDPYLPKETANAIERAVSHASVLGLSPDELICDVTGGTTAMTVGALQACCRTQITMQMVPAVSDPERRALRPLAPILIELDGCTDISGAMPATET